MKIHEIIKLALEDNTNVFVNDGDIYTASDILSYAVEDLPLTGWETHSISFSCKQKQVIALLREALELWQESCDEQDCDSCACGATRSVKGDFCGILDDLHDTFISAGFMQP